MFNANGLFETGVTYVPKATNGKAKVISQGPSLVLFKNENPQAVLATWLFTQYLNSTTVQARFALASGYLPVTKTAAQLKEYQDFLEKAAGNSTGIAALATKVALEQEKNYYTSAVFIGSAYARDEVASLLKKIMIDQTINSSNADQKILAYFEEAIENCEYQAG